MAKAVDKVTPTQKWVKLGQYRDLHAGRIGRLDFANQRALEELKRGLPFRFIDLNDIQRSLQDKLPDGYPWDLADVDWDSATAVWPERTVNHAVTTENMISMGVRRFPELRIYGIEVQVLDVTSTESVMPTEQTAGERAPSTPCRRQEDHQAAVSAAEPAPLSTQTDELDASNAPAVAETQADEPVKQYDTGVEWLKAVTWRDESELSGMKNASAVARHLAAMSAIDKTCRKPVGGTYILNLLIRKDPRLPKFFP
jgi:hypothetical protein